MQCYSTASGYHRQARTQTASLLSSRFTKNGLVVQASKLFGKGEERLAPYGAGLRYQIEEGTFHLFIGAETKAAMSVECSADNVYPGLNMLGVLCSRGADAPRIAG